MWEFQNELNTDRPWKLKEVMNRRSLLEFNSLKALFTFPSDVFSTKLFTSCSASSGLEKSRLRINDVSEKSCVPWIKSWDSWTSCRVKAQTWVVISSLGPSSTRELMLCRVLRTLCPSTKDTQSSRSVPQLRPRSSCKDKGGLGNIYFFESSTRPENPIDTALHLV